jgi:hypothetical protein
VACLQAKHVPMLDVQLAGLAQASDGELRKMVRTFYPQQPKKWIDDFASHPPEVLRNIARGSLLRERLMEENKWSKEEVDVAYSLLQADAALDGITWWREQRQLPVPAAVARAAGVADGKALPRRVNPTVWRAEQPYACYGGGGFTHPWELLSGFAETEVSTSSTRRACRWSAPRLRPQRGSGAPRPRRSGGSRTGGR